MSRLIDAYLHIRNKLYFRNPQTVRITVLLGAAELILCWLHQAAVRYLYQIVSFLPVVLLVLYQVPLLTEQSRKTEETLGIYMNQAAVHAAELYQFCAVSACFCIQLFGVTVLYFRCFSKACLLGTASVLLNFYLYTAGLFAVYLTVKNLIRLRLPALLDAAATACIPDPFHLLKIGYLHELGTLFGEMQIRFQQENRFRLGDALAAFAELRSFFLLLLLIAVLLGLSFLYAVHAERERMLCGGV